MDKENFRAFVYNDKQQKLANNFNEFENLIASGLWFAEKPASKERKQKNDIIRSASK